MRRGSREGRADDGDYKRHDLMRGPCVLVGDAYERVRLVSPDETMGGVR